MLIISTSNHSAVSAFNLWAATLSGSISIECYFIHFFWLRSLRRCDLIVLFLWSSFFLRREMRIGLDFETVKFVTHTRTQPLQCQVKRNFSFLKISSNCKKVRLVYVEGKKQETDLRSIREEMFWESELQTHEVCQWQGMTLIFVCNRKGINVALERGARRARKNCRYASAIGMLGLHLAYRWNADKPRAANKCGQ